MEYGGACTVGSHRVIGSPGLGMVGIELRKRQVRIRDTFIYIAESAFEKELFYARCKLRK